MKLKKTKFKDLVIYEKNTYKDKRGYFRELYLQKHLIFRQRIPDRLSIPLPEIFATIWFGPRRYRR